MAIPVIYKYNKLVTMLFKILELDIDTGYELTDYELKIVEKYKEFNIRHSIDKNRFRKSFWQSLCRNKNSNVIDIIKLIPEYIQWTTFCENTNNIKYIKTYINELSRQVWFYLCKNTNPQAIELIEANMHLIEPDCWHNLSKNPSAIHLIRKNPDKIDWNELILNTNPEAIDILEANYTKINLYSLYNLYNLCNNQNPAILRILEPYADKLNDTYWSMMSSNPYATPLLIKNPEKINWYYFSQNPHPDAVKMILQNPDKYSDKYSFRGLSLNTNPEIVDKILKYFNSECDNNDLCENPNALPILEKQLESISWYSLATNYSLFDLDYQAMSIARTAIIYDELLANAMHPDRYARAYKIHMDNGGRYDNFTPF